MKILMKVVQIFFFLFSLQSVCAQTDSIHFIKVHFLYGSKPKKKFRTTEFKNFGGLHGGHVSIEVDSIDYNFEPTYAHHLFPHRRRKKADFVENRLDGKPRYSEGSKSVTFSIPLSAQQYAQIKAIHKNYSANTPYDYAFFGMRCANSTQDILGQIGVLKKKKRFINIITTFYPRKLRKRLFKLANKKNYRVTTTNGRDTRKWEKD